MELPDRQTALLLGVRMYQGPVCKAGHTGTRYIHNSACVQCEKENGAARKRINADSEKARRRAWRKANRDKVNAAKRRQKENWTPEQRARNAARDREYEQLDPNGKRAARREALRVASAARTAERKALQEARLRDPVYQAQRKAKARAAAATKRANRTQKQIELDQARSRSYYQKQKAENYDGMLDRWRHKKRIRKARLRGADITATTQDSLVILANQGGACAYCGDTDDLHLDHKVAVSRGGHHTFTNLQWLCAWHNMSKHAQSDSEYRLANNIPAVTAWDSLI